MRELNPERHSQSFAGDAFQATFGVVVGLLLVTAGCMYALSDEQRYALAEPLPKPLAHLFLPAAHGEILHLRQSSAAPRRVATQSRRTASASAPHSPEMRAPQHHSSAPRAEPGIDPVEAQSARHRSQKRSKPGVSLQTPEVVKATPEQDVDFWPKIPATLEPPGQLRTGTESAPESSAPERTGTESQAVPGTEPAAQESESAPEHSEIVPQEPHDLEPAPEHSEPAPEEPEPTPSELQPTPEHSEPAPRDSESYPKPGPESERASTAAPESAPESAPERTLDSAPNLPHSSSSPAEPRRSSSQLAAAASPPAPPAPSAELWDNKELPAGPPCATAASSFQGAEGGPALKVFVYPAEFFGGEGPDGYQGRKLDLLMARMRWDSAVRTEDPEEADFFVVQYYRPGTARGDDGRADRVHWLVNHRLPAIRNDYPFLNRSIASNRPNHILFFGGDHAFYQDAWFPYGPYECDMREGGRAWREEESGVELPGWMNPACPDRALIFVHYLGNHDTKLHRNVYTCMLCFQRGKDIRLPSPDFDRWEMYADGGLKGGIMTWDEYDANSRDIEFMFLGTLPPGHAVWDDATGRRQLHAFANYSDKWVVGEVLGTLAEADSGESIMRRAQLCYNPLGATGGDSNRYVPATMFGCISIWLSNQGEVHRPFDDVIPYDKFSVSVEVAELRRLPEEVAKVTEAQRRAMFLEMKQYWSYMFWRPPPGVHLLAPARDVLRGRPDAYDGFLAVLRARKIQWHDLPLPPLRRSIGTAAEEVFMTRYLNLTAEWWQWSIGDERKDSEDAITAHRKAKKAEIAATQGEDAAKNYIEQQTTASVEAIRAFMNESGPLCDIGLLSAE